MMSYFVTGTDTDAGKTHVSRALLLAAKRQSLSCAGYKPIESGCPTAGSPGNDAIALSIAAGTEPITTYTFAPPIAPHIAARRAKQEIAVGRIVATTRRLQGETDFLLVEGAGGFLVPLSSTASMADLAKELQLPLLIVTADRLGAINHALLSIEAAKTRNLEIAALVLTEVYKGAGDGLENRQSIAQFGQVPVYELPHCDGDEPMADAAMHIFEALK
jgi:dethiobiotin synthetase